VTAALAESHRFCAEVSRREAKNFYASFRLLPPDRRRSMCALYAYLRRTDDLADGDDSAVAKARALETWRRDLDRALDGRPDGWPGLAALAETVDRHAIPRQLLHDAIDGVEMDVLPLGFATFEELRTYCYRVASAVGLSCLHIWGFRSEGGRAEELADRCGVALQLTNILRDVREDAERGRIYWPLEDLDRFGVAPGDLSGRRPSDAVRALLAFQGQRAGSFYREAAPLSRLVAPVGRPALGAIVGIYRALLDEIARRNYDVLADRISIPRWRKAAIAARSWAAGRLSCREFAGEDRA